MDRFRNKKVLVVGVGKTGFSLINFFNRLNCEIRVTDIKPIFELNKAVKRLKKIRPAPEMTFGEHNDEDFLDADIIVFGPAINPRLPQLELARSHGKEVYSQLELSTSLCDTPIIAVCGGSGRTTVAHMLGHAIKQDGKNAFVGGGSDNPLINHWIHNSEEKLDFVVLEISVEELQQYNKLKPFVTIFTNVSDEFNEKRFKTFGDYIESQISIVNNLDSESFLIVNYDRLSSNSFFKSSNAATFWYTRRSFASLGILGEVQGTHFHERRIQSGIHNYSTFRVSNLRVIGEKNRENLLAAVTAAKTIKLSDEAIQTTIEKFPGIPHRLEFVMEKNGVSFYNDSKSESMDDLKRTLESFKTPVILIAGGRDTEQVFDNYFDILKEKVRVMVLVGECKERLNRVLGDSSQTYIVGSFEESILIAYQKSRTGDTILLSPGNVSTDIFRDYEERGNYFKKLVYQL